MIYFFNVCFCSLVLHVLCLNVLVLFINSTWVYFPFFDERGEVLSLTEGGGRLSELHLLVYSRAPPFSPNAASVLFTVGLPK